jgi:hypothetical protein
MLRLLFSSWHMLYLNILKKTGGEFEVIGLRPLFGLNHEICLYVDSSPSLDVNTTIVSTSVKCSCFSNIVMKVFTYYTSAFFQ